MSGQTTQYIPLHQHDLNEGKEVDGSVEADEPLLRIIRQPRRSLERWEYVTHGILLLLCALFFALWLSSKATCTYISQYSPANEAIEYIEHFKYKASLYFTTEWRGEPGDPTPENDAAWRRISTDVKPTRISKEKLKMMGMSAGPSTVQFREEDGGGYMASLEVTHQLQCLDMLRKFTYREHYESFDTLFQGDEDALMKRLEQCLEVLRQALMCYPDTNMVVYYWVQGYDNPYPDTNTLHRCKNFDRVLDWAAKNAVDGSHVTRAEI
ncbi:hypothetical protein HYDPIDRAFT_38982 [Hydnomerulius pinastri MD-312]|nr:hypothetical protein HYDPIDRAFT_38982 [Hydnomerulius pinastri MD-312]